MWLNWNILWEEKCLELAFEGRESSIVPDVLGEIVPDVGAKVWEEEEEEARLDWKAGQSAKDWQNELSRPSPLVTTAAAVTDDSLSQCRLEVSVPDT